MKSFGSSTVVDTGYKIGLRTIIIFGVLLNVIITIAVIWITGHFFNLRLIPVLIAAGIVILFSVFDSYFLLGFLIKPIKLATNRLLLLAEGDLRSEKVKHTHLTETSVMVRAMNAVIDINNQYINEIKRVLKNVENKNLAVEVDANFAGDFSAIKTSLTNIITFLNDTMRQIGTSSNEVASSADLVSNGAITLSQGATEQASAVEELTASLDTLASQTTLNAQNAEKASSMAATAKKEAERGDMQMREMLEAMDAISTSSSGINKIIKVIDDIAFQTNILALNAAVEAARAGQHGKGFAVVAEEVRSLAAKSANAVKDTADMIDGSIRNVASGIRIANDTAEALKRIVNEVTSATDLVGSIAVASKEQALGIEQINQGIMQVSQVVQSNAATSEESAAASEELSGQANQLKEIISLFRVKQNGVHEQKNRAELEARGAYNMQALPEQAYPRY
jgi:methyl-accepting chemotaxis protein